MQRLIDAVQRLGLSISHGQPKTDEGHHEAKTLLLKDKKGRAFVCIMHPDTMLSTKLLSSRLGCGKGGVAEATSALTKEVFSSAASGAPSAITLGCVMECPHAMGVLLDQELNTEFWVGAAHGSGSIFLDGFHVAELLGDRSLRTIDFSANPKIDRDNPPDLKAFADALEPLPKELLEKAGEAEEKQGTGGEGAKEKKEKKEKTGKGNKDESAKAGAQAAKTVLDVNALADALIEQISALPDDAEAQRRAKLDIASRLNQLRNAAYAAGFTAK